MDTIEVPLMKEPVEDIIEVPLMKEPVAPVAAKPVPSLLDTVSSLNKQAGEGIIRNLQGISGTVGAVAETALGAGTGALAFPAGWLTELMQTFKPGATPESAAASGAQVAEALTYQPKDPRAIDALQKIFYPVEAGLGMAREAADLVSESRGVPKNSLERRRGQMAAEAGAMLMQGKAIKPFAEQGVIAADAIRRSTNMDSLKGIIDQPTPEVGRYVSPELEAQKVAARREEIKVQRQAQIPSEERLAEMEAEIKAHNETVDVPLMKEPLRGEKDVPDYIGDPDAILADASKPIDIIKAPEVLAAERAAPIIPTPVEVAKPAEIVKPAEAAKPVEIAKPEPATPSVVLKTDAEGEYVYHATSKEGLRGIFDEGIDPKKSNEYAYGDELGPRTFLTGDAEFAKQYGDRVLRIHRDNLDKSELFDYLHEKSGLYEERYHKVIPPEHIEALADNGKWIPLRKNMPKVGAEAPLVQLLKQDEQARNLADSMKTTVEAATEAKAIEAAKAVEAYVQKRAEAARKKLASGKYSAEDKAALEKQAAMSKNPEAALDAAVKAPTRDNTLRKTSTEVQHFSPVELQNGVDFNAFFGDSTFHDTFSGNFGTYKYTTTVPRSARILDILDGSARSNKFMSDLARRIFPDEAKFAQDLMRGDKNAIQDFYNEIFMDKDRIIPAIKDAKLDGVQYAGEYLLTKEANKRFNELDRPIAPDPLDMPETAAEAASLDRAARRAMIADAQVKFNAKMEARGVQKTRRAKREEKPETYEESPEKIVDDALDEAGADKWNALLEKEGLGELGKDPLDEAISLEDAGLIDRDPYMTDRGPREIDFGFMGTQQAQALYEMTVRLVRESPTMQNAVRLAKTAMVDGVKTFGEFRAVARQVLGDAFAKVAGHLRDAWEAAKRWNDDLGQRGAWNIRDIKKEWPAYFARVANRRMREAGIEPRVDTVVDEPRFLNQTIAADFRKKDGTPGIDHDATYNKGALWEGVDPSLRPATKSDMTPQTPDSFKADLGNLPFKTGELNSLHWDLPYLVKRKTDIGEYGKMSDRFTAFENMEDLLRANRDGLKEAARVLREGGRLLIKTQDVSAPGTAGSAISKGNQPVIAAIQYMADHYGLKYISGTNLINTHPLPLASNILIQKTPRKITTTYLTFEKAGPNHKSLWNTVNDLLGQRGSVPLPFKDPIERILDKADRVLRQLKDPGPQVASTLADAPVGHNILDNAKAPTEKEIKRFGRWWADPIYRWKDTPIEPVLWKGIFGENQRAHAMDIDRLALDKATKSLLDSEQIILTDVLREKLPAPNAKIAEAAQQIRDWLAAKKVYVQDSMLRVLDEAYKDRPNVAQAAKDILDGKTWEDAIKDNPYASGRRIDPRILQDIINEYDAVDKWGVDDYLPNVEKGDLVLVDSKGQVVAFDVSKVGLAKKAVDYWRTVGADPHLKIENKSQVQMDRDLRAGLTGNAFGAVQKKLTKAIMEQYEAIGKAAAEEIAKTGMQGTFTVKPANVYSPYMQTRRGLTRGEENIIPELYKYSASINKKISIDPVLREIRGMLADKSAYKMQEVQSQYLEKFAQDLKGNYTAQDRAFDFIASEITSWANNKFKTDLVAPTYTYTRGLGALRSGTAKAMLGYRPVAAAVNIASGNIHTLAKVGEKLWLDSLGFLKTPEGLALMREVESRMGMSVVDEAVGIRSTAGPLDALGLFQMAEAPNRKICIAANYLLETKLNGKPHAEAVEAALRANFLQQFMYNTAALPSWMRGPGMRTIAQFKPYLVKELQFIRTLKGTELMRYAAYNLLLGGPKAFHATLKSIPFIQMVTGPELWNQSEEFMNKHLPRLSRGLPGMFPGVDLSASAAVQFPQKPKEWLGPTMSPLFELAKIGANREKGIGVEPGEGIGNALQSYVVWGRNLKDIVDAVMTKDGWILNQQGQRMYNLYDLGMPKAEQMLRTGAFIGQRAIGAQPVQLSADRAADRIAKEREKAMTANRAITVDHLVDWWTDKPGVPLPKELKENYMAYQVNTDSLVNNKKFRIMTPLQRRMALAELQARPEILEEAPRAEDTYDIPDIIVGRRQRLLQQRAE
ncbi:MAG: hypothetical protein WC455_23615 [Dehalococcoidia bacterium]